MLPQEKVLQKFLRHRIHKPSFASIPFNYSITKDNIRWMNDLTLEYKINTNRPSYIPRILLFRHYHHTPRFLDCLYFAVFPCFNMHPNFILNGHKFNRRVEPSKYAVTISSYSFNLPNDAHCIAIKMICMLPTMKVCFR
jgi:hypothetical protein